MIETWDDLPFWSSGEWDVVQEHLDDLDKAKVLYNPKRELIFAALDAVPMNKVRVCILGQDPYPDRTCATGIAFSVPKKINILPQTLLTIFNEYIRDLGYSTPKSGDLSHWCQEGVLLWNVYPTCSMGKSLSHKWVEWEELTKEILEELSKRDVVFCSLGSYAQSMSKYIDHDTCHHLHYSHPSPRSALKAKHPFVGSRMFSAINAKLSEQGSKPIDWRLS